MKPFAPPFKTSAVGVIGFAFLSSLITPLAFAAGVTVRFVGEQEQWDGFTATGVAL